MCCKKEALCLRGLKAILLGKSVAGKDGAATQDPHSLGVQLWLCRNLIAPSRNHVQTFPSFSHSHAVIMVFSISAYTTSYLVSFFKLNKSIFT